MESAFNAAPLNASLPAITAAEPVIGILLGVVVFGDDIRISPGTLALQAAGLAALVGGVILVARAPMLSGLRPVQAISQALSADHPEADHPEHAEATSDSPPGPPVAKKPEREEV
jgi:hypothetical protein